MLANAFHAATALIDGLPQPFSIRFAGREISAVQIHFDNVPTRDLNYVVDQISSRLLRMRRDVKHHRYATHDHIREQWFIAGLFVHGDVRLDVLAQVDQATDWDEGR